MLGGEWYNKPPDYIVYGARAAIGASLENGIKEKYEYNTKLTYFPVSVILRTSYH